MALPEPSLLLNSIPPELLHRFDPVYVEHYNKYNVGRLHTHQLPIEKIRKNPGKYAIPYARTGKVDVYRVSEQLCPVEGNEIKVRIFEPGEWKEGDELRGAYINYHGGGWTWGNLEQDDVFCRRITKEVGCLSFDVDYRLAPENRFPIPVNDSWAALKWVISKAGELKIDINKIAIGGVSAGGHIAAVLAHMARDEGIPLALQLLAVPCVDVVHDFRPDGEVRDDCPYPSVQELYWTAALPVERMQYAHECFVGLPRAPELEKDWRLSPMLHPNFKNLSPALIMTAEMDPLRDEGEAYGAKMNREGSQAKVIRYNGVPHPFMMYDLILKAAQDYNRDFVNALKGAFGIL